MAKGFKTGGRNFAPGHKLAVKRNRRQSPARMSDYRWCYEEEMEICRKAPFPTYKERFDCIHKMMQFLQGELIGTPPQRIDLKMEGGLTVKVVIE